MKPVVSEHRPTGGPVFAVVDRMVALELLKTLMAILSVLVVIIVSRQFLNILQKAIEGEVAAETLFQLLGLKTLSVTAILIPPSMFMAILIVIGRMYRDQEMAILASAGMGSRRLLRALAWTGVPVLVLSAYMALVSMPWTEREAQTLIKRDEQSADVRGIRPGRFNEFSSGDVVLYAEAMGEDNVMRNIFVQSRQNEMTGVVIADHGHLHRNDIGENFVVLNDGRRYQGVPGQMDYVISEFTEYGVRISGPEAASEALRREAVDTPTLLHSRDPKLLAELQRRLSLPLGVLFLSLLAVPLARVAPRRGPYGNIFAAFLIFVIYENLLKISQALLMTGKIPPGVGPAVVYGLVLLTTFGILVGQRGWGWLRWRLLGGAKA